MIHASAFETVTGQLGGAAAYITLGLVIYKLVYSLVNKEERATMIANMKEAAADLQALAGGEEEEAEEEGGGDEEPGGEPGGDAMAVEDLNETPQKS